MKLLLIGGYPKQYTEPFSPKTLSGKRLRAIVAELHIDAEYLDLWENAQQEKEARVKPSVVLKIERAYVNDHRLIVALGNHVFKALLRAQRKYPKTSFAVIQLPHPASRRQGDLDTLRRVLGKLAIIYPGLQPLMR